VCIVMSVFFVCGKVVCEISMVLLQDISILEIGVKKGGSLKLWRELFSDSSFIFGMDIDPAIPTFVRDAHIKTLVIDSQETELVQRGLRGLLFDIILDDGNHQPEAQLKTFETLQPFLKPTGVYVIEDVYDLKLDPFQAMGMGWSRHADKSLVEDVVFLYPGNSQAPKIKLGWKSGTGPRQNQELVALA